MPDLVDRIRAACALVADRSQRVRIEHERIPGYAARLPPPSRKPAAAGPPAGASSTAAEILTLDAINFGSGWFPTLRKRPDMSGFRTVEAGLRGRVERSGAWSAVELAGLTASEVADALGQDRGHELMALFSASLNDLGRHLRDDFGGSFDAVHATGGSAVRVVERLAAWECFADTSRYGELPVPLFKRAQIAAADLARAGVALFSDLDRLTLFADNLVPHVLRLDGILTFDDGLVARIEREELIEHGSPEEVEIRACAVHAVELIAAQARGWAPYEIDELLWDRGAGPQYKARPRHRSRCTAY